MATRKLPHHNSSSKKLCECGCGRATAIAKLSDARRGQIKGQPVRFLRGHRRRTFEVPSINSNPTDLCMCGCGQPAPVAKTTAMRRGVVKGQRLRFIHGHNAKIRTTHGHAPRGHRSLTYTSYTDMRRRCTNPNCPKWPTYGGANPPVGFCSGLALFVSFLEHLGERPAGGYSLGRYLDSGSYRCGGCEECTAKGWIRNCEWQTTKEQGYEKMGHTTMLRFRKAFGHQGVSLRTNRDGKLLTVSRKQKEKVA
jgi:hypothetical protein